MNLGILKHRLPTQEHEIDGEWITLSQAVVRAQVSERAGASTETVVIVPDPPNLIEHHRQVIDALAKDFRVVCFELPGFGFSRPKPGFRFTLEEQAAAMIELLDTLAVRNAVLEIACLGAFVGMKVAQWRPDLIRKLLLLQVPCYAQARQWSRRTDPLGLIGTPWIGQFLIHLGKSAVARHWYRAALPASHSHALYDRYLRPTLAGFRQGACFCLADAYQLLRRQPHFDVELSQKTIAIWGSADETHRATDKASIQRQIPQARLVEFEGCGHFPSLEASQRYLSLLYRELAGEFGKESPHHHLQ